MGEIDLGEATFANDLFDVIGLVEVGEEAAPLKYDFPLLEGDLVGGVDAHVSEVTRDLEAIERAFGVELKEIVFRNFFDHGEVRGDEGNAFEFLFGRDLVKVLVT